MRYVRYTVFALAGLLVLTLGFAVIPGQPPAQEPPSLTEQARASALDDALALRSAGLDLADAAPAGNPVSGPADRVVTLLTFHARALLPAGSPSPSAPPPSAPAPSGPATATTAPSPAPDPARTAINLAKAVAASGSRRLEDAATADGGMARLLAGAGTAQLLAAAELAAAAGDPGAVAGAATTAGNTPNPAGGAPVGSADAAGSPSPAPGSGRGGTPGRCPAPAPAGGQEPATGAAPTEAAPEAGPQAAEAPFAGSADAALSAVLQAGQQALYGYQAAMPRLAPADAGSASDFLEQHRQLVADTETRLRQACLAVAPQAPGYVLDAAFLEDPARGLGALEAAALPAYGDLVALTDGADRAWALAALRQATVRTVRWGADPGPVPGIVLDTAALPVLPDGEEAQARQ